MQLCLKQKIRLINIDEADIEAKAACILYHKYAADTGKAWTMIGLVSFSTNNTSTGMYM